MTLCPVSYIFIKESYIACERKRGTSIWPVNITNRHYSLTIISPKTYRSLGLLHLKEKRPQDAMQYLRLYLEKSPEAKDREMIEFYLTME